MWPPRLLANENLPAPSIRQLRAAGIEVAAIRKDSPGIDDASVLALAEGCSAGCSPSTWTMASSTRGSGRDAQGALDQAAVPELGSGSALIAINCLGRARSGDFRDNGVLNGRIRPWTC